MQRYELWKLLRGKMVFLGASREIMDFFGVVGGSLAQKTGLL
jgi:hypothetical protein